MPGATGFFPAGLPEPGMTSMSRTTANGEGSWKVQALWERQNGELIIRDIDNPRPLHLRIDEISYTLTFPVNSGLPMVPDGSVSVGIDCLPVE